VQELLTYRNEEKTAELQAQPRYKLLNDWCKENGVLHPGVEYPVAFGRHGELVGMAASRDIPPQTAFLFVPQNLFICEDNIRMRSPLLSALYDRNPAVFKRHHDSEYLIIIVYIWHEQMKGEKSFWFPYFDTINTCDMPMSWTDAELDEFQDSVLKQNLKTYYEEYKEEFKTVIAMLRLDVAGEEIIPGCTDKCNEEL